MWTYFGITVEPAKINSGGYRWSALVDFVDYAGYLHAETKAGMRHLIKHYRNTQGS